MVSSFSRVLRLATAGPVVLLCHRKDLQGFCNRIPVTHESFSWLKSDPRQCQGVLKRLSERPKQCLNVSHQYDCRNNVYKRLKMLQGGSRCLDLFMTHRPLSVCVFCVTIGGKSRTRRGHFVVLLCMNEFFLK